MPSPIVRMSSPIMRMRGIEVGGQKDLPTARMGLLASAGFALGLAACGTNANVPCNSKVEMVPHAVAVDVEARAAMTFLGGEAGFSVRLGVKGNDEIYTRGKLTIKAGTDNIRWGFNEAGDRIERTSSENPFPLCTKDNRKDCTLYLDPRLLPTGVVLVNSEGMYRLHELDGDRYAVWGELKDRTFARNVYKYDFGVVGEINVVGYDYTDWATESSKVFWFRVNEYGNIVNVDGTPIAADDMTPPLQSDLLDENGIPKPELGGIPVPDSEATSLKKAFAYYQTDSDGNYPPVDGQPVDAPSPDPGLLGVVFEIMPDPSVKPAGIIYGIRKDPNDPESEWLYSPLVTWGEDGSIDTSALESAARGLSYSVEVRDNRGIVNGTQTFFGDNPVPITDVTDAVAMSVDPAFYDNGKPDMTIFLNFTRDPNQFGSTPYIYSAKFDALADVSVLENEGCEK